MVTDHDSSSPSTHPHTHIHTHTQTDQLVCLYTRLPGISNAGIRLLHCTGHKSLTHSLARPTSRSWFLGTLHSVILGSTGKMPNGTTQPSPMDRRAALCCYVLCSVYEWTRGCVCWTGGWECYEQTTSFVPLFIPFLLSSLGRSPDSLIGFTNPSSWMKGCA